MRMTRILICCAVLLCSCCLRAVTADAATEDTVTLRLDPAEIDVGVFYHGADIQVSAEVDECDGAVLVLEKGAEELTFNRKGRKAGIWLNVAQVTISGAPRVYLMASSGELSDICPETVQRQLGLGIASLRDRMKITSEKPLTGSEVEEYLKLKRETGTYDTEISINVAHASGNREQLSASLPIAATVPPGEYEVALYTFRDGQLTQRKTGNLVIRRVGLANLLASMAQDRAAAYGIMAILIAMLVGILMGVVFRSRPGSGH
jgi:uncharacterized protein (TIGR02186 family)